MDIKCSLAMTAAEYAGAEVLPGNVAWMACHFSNGGKGLSNLPRELPPDSVVMVDDSTPAREHNPELILQQLEALAQQLQVSTFILDFQRPAIAENAQIAQLLVRQLPCPVCVSEHYAADLDCPVFLSPPLLHRTLEAHLAPWKGREVWLEAALESEQITVTPEGSNVEAIAFYPPGQESFEDTSLHCRYHIRVEEDHAVFTLTRDNDMLKRLLADAEKQGIRQAVGLYQQLWQCFE